jgi:DNA-binding transcriptional LysR family regulator
MTLESLRCFCAVVENRSFRVAAEQVFRSQPAVSQQLKNLETEVGHTLVERKTGQPTPLGKLLYDRARQLLSDMESLTREVDDYARSGQGELRVGTSDTTALYVLPPYVRRFTETLPQTRLVIINRNSDAIAQQVLHGELDLGIITLPVHHAELAQQELFKQKLVLVTPAQHALAHRKKITLSDLEDEPMLLLAENRRTGSLLQDYFRQEDFTPQKLLDSGSFEVIKRYIAEGIGVSFLPEAVVDKSDSHRLATIPLPGLPEVPIGAIWRKGAYRSHAERAFLDLLLE